MTLYLIVIAETLFYQIALYVAIRWMLYMSMDILGIARPAEREWMVRTMSEAIAFFCGLATMAIVWFFNDTKSNPYLRGYAEGLNVGIQESMKGLAVIQESMKDLDKVIIELRGDSDE